MTQIMVAFEKHGNRYFDMRRGIGPVAKALLQERMGDGHWYDADAVALANKALSDNPRFVPWHFLASRCDHEYERVEIVDLEEIA